MTSIKRIVVTNTDPMVLAELRKDYALLGFSTSPIEGDSFSVYSRRPEQDLTKHKKKKERPKRNRDNRQDS